jgi:hypothetical protein
MYLATERVPIIILQVDKMKTHHCASCGPVVCDPKQVPFRSHLARLLIYNKEQKWSTLIPLEQLLRRLQ